MQVEGKIWSVHTLSKVWNVPRSICLVLSIKCERFWQALLPSTMPPETQSNPIQSTKFILPGIAALGTFASLKTELAYAFTFSYKTNIRNLENYSHGFWELVFAHLTFDLPRMIVVPQYVLYHKKWSGHAPSNPDPDATQASITTEPDATAQSVIPDFAVVQIRVKWASQNKSTTFRDAKIRGAGLPILIEVKRFCSRSLEEDTEAFFFGLRDALEEAQLDLEVQAKHLFRAHGRQTSVILAACAGNWWRYRVIDRSFFYSLDDDEYVPTMGEQTHGDSAGDEIPEGTDITEGYEDDEDGDSDEGDSDGEEDYSDEDSTDPLDIIDLPESNVNMAHRLFEIAKTIAEDELEHEGTSRWTGMMRINTATSNQRMFVIHELLKKISESRSYSRG
jgi:hypothetical protein